MSANIISKNEFIQMKETFLKKKIWEQKTHCAHLEGQELLN